MGNRCVIFTNKDKNANKETAIGLYIHWDSEPYEVKAYLSYCKLRGYRCPENDGYGWARLCQVVCNKNTHMFKGAWMEKAELEDGLGVGIEEFCMDDEQARWLDHGFYFIEKWDVVDCTDPEDLEAYNDVDDEQLIWMMNIIDSRFPEEVRYGEQAIREFVEGGCVQTKVSGQFGRLITN